MNYRRSIVSSLLTLLSNESPRVAASYFDEKDKYGNVSIRTLEDQASAVAAASRDKVCTIILFGAPWDGHFEAFVNRGRWHELADLVRDDDGSIELAFFQYHGGPTGPGSIPPELLATPTISSYDWYAYRGGRKLWEDGGTNPTRKCRNNNNDWERGAFEWDVSCFKMLCGLGAGSKVPTVRESFEIML